MKNEDGNRNRFIFWTMVFEMMVYYHYNPSNHEQELKNKSQTSKY